MSKVLILKANLITLGFAVLMGAAIALLNIREDSTGLGWTYFLVFTAVGGIFIFVVMFVFSLVFVLINSTVKSGVLGQHTYTIEDAGFRERTEANDSLNFWPSIPKIEKTRTAIVLQINPWLFHVLPRRGFDNDEFYEAFFDELISHTTK